MGVLEGSTANGEGTVSDETVRSAKGRTGSFSFEGESTEGLLRIGEVTKSTGLTARTLRYWEEIGLISPIDHIENRERRYSVKVLERIDVIRRLQEVLGLSLAEVKAVLEQEDRLLEVVSRYRKDLDSGTRLVMLTEAKRANDEIVKRLEDRLSEIGRFRMERVERGQRIDLAIEQVLREVNH